MSQAIMTIVMVLVMAVSSIGGMTAEMQEPVSFDAKISADVQTVMMMTGNGASMDQDALTAVGDILSALTLKGTADKDRVELGLFAGEQEETLLTLGAKKDGEAVTVASSLLGSQVIDVTAEEAQAIMQQMGSSVNTAAIGGIPEVDKEQMQKDSAELTEKLTKAFEAKMGETENGEFTVDGIAFTSRTPVNMTYEEAAELLLTSVKELIEKESYQQFLQAMQQSQNKDLAAEIDKAIEKIRNGEAEKFDTFELAVYADENGCKYNTGDMTKLQAKEEPVVDDKAEDAEAPAEEAAPAEETAPAEEPAPAMSLHFGFGTIEGEDLVVCNFLQDKATADIRAKTVKEGAGEITANIDASGTKAVITANTDGAGNMEMNVSIQSPQLPISLHVATGDAGEDRKSYALELSITGMPKALLSISGTAGKGGTFLSAFEGEGVEAIPFAKLSDASDTTTSGKLSMSMMASVLKAITTLTKNLPESSATWLNTQVTNAMNPATPAPAPQEEPALAE